LVCDSSELSALDRRLASTFRVTLASTRAAQGDEGVKRLRERQRAWIDATRTRCQTQACVAKSYYERMEELGQ
jgi:uncharacterized protein